MIIKWLLLIKSQFKFGLYHVVDVHVHPPQQQHEPGDRTTELFAAQVAPILELKVSIFSPPF